MKKAFILIGLFLPLLGMSQSYCLTDFGSTDEAELVKFYYGNYNELVAYEAFDFVDPGDPVTLRDTLVYDANGDCVKIKNYQFIDNQWKYTYYIDYTYDANHNRLSRENYNSFDGGVTFDLGGRYEYTYEGDHIVSYVMYFVGSEFLRGAYTYNAQGQLVELLETQNDPWGGTGWENSARSVWEYNEFGQCTTATFYYWNYTGWDLSKRKTFQYDAAGNTAVVSTYENAGLVDRKGYYFDYNTPIEEVIMPVDPEGDYKWETFKTRPLGFAWETADANGNLQYICDYNYNYCEVSGVNSMVADLQEMSLYPNPTSGVVRISNKDVERVEVIDQNGRIVLQQANGSLTLDLGNLPAGLYVVKAYDGQHWNFGKVQVN